MIHSEMRVAFVTQGAIGRPAFTNYNPSEIISRAHVLIPGNIGVLSGGTVIL